jgi:hypothetical protein
MSHRFPTAARPAPEDDSFAPSALGPVIDRFVDTLQDPSLTSEERGWRLFGIVLGGVIGVALGFLGVVLPRHRGTAITLQVLLALDGAAARATRPEASAALSLAAAVAAILAGVDQRESALVGPVVGYFPHLVRRTVSAPINWLRPRVEADEEVAGFAELGRALRTLLGPA